MIPGDPVTIINDMAEKMSNTMIATEEEKMGVHNLVVVLREDQIQLIAKAVVDLLHEGQNGSSRSL